MATGDRERLSLADFEGASSEFDQLVASRGGQYCSSSGWIIPARAAFNPKSTGWIFSQSDCFTVLCRSMHEQGFWVLTPLESLWGLSCPLVGEPQASVSLLLSKLARYREDWRFTLLTGIAPGGGLAKEILASLATRFRCRVQHGTPRFVANLEGGVEKYLGRRTANFRRAIRKSQRYAEGLGIKYEHLHKTSLAEPRTYQRILSVEAKSWKGIEGVGITESPMRDFYELMLKKPETNYELRVSFAKLEGEDVGYVLGAVFNQTYRGLQFSYVDSVRSLSIGSLLQMMEIERLCNDGVLSYDLGGTGVDYKRRWSDEIVPSLAVVVENN